FRTEGLVNAFHRGTAAQNLADAVRRIMHVEVTVEAVVGDDPGPGPGGAPGPGPGGASGPGAGGPGPGPGGGGAFGPASPAAPAGDPGRGGPASGGPAPARGSGASVGGTAPPDRKSTRLNSSHVSISYAVFCQITQEAHTTLQDGNCL